MPIRRKPWETAGDENTTTIQEVGVRTGTVGDGRREGAAAVSMAGHAANDEDEQQPLDTTSIVKPTTGVEEKAAVAPSVEQEQGQNSQGSRHLEQSTFRSDGRPSWYDDIGVPLFNDDNNQTDSTSAEVECDVPQAREDQSLNDIVRVTAAAGS